MSTAQGNPYDFISPVKDPKYFAGRKEELKEIEYYLDEARSAKPQFFNLALIGARASGKTSLLNMIDCMAKEKGLLAVRLSLNNEVVDSDVLFFKELFDLILTKGIERGMFGGPTDKIQRALRKVIDRLEVGVDFPFDFGSVYVGWKEGAKTTFPQSVLVQDLKKIATEAKSKNIPAIVLLFDECDLFSKNETLLQKIRNAFQELEGFMLVFSGTKKMFPALSDVFSPIPRFFKRITVENFKVPEETKECVLKPLNEEEAKLVDDTSVIEIHFLTGGSPYEVNLVSHYMFKRWSRQAGQKMSLSVDVLDDVLKELEAVRKIEHHTIADKVKTLWPDYLKVLVTLLEFPKVTRDALLRYNLMSQLTTATMKDLVNHKSYVGSVIGILIENGVIVEDEEKNLVYKGDQFDTLYLKYNAMSKGVTEFFVGTPGEPVTNFWRKFEKVMLAEFDEYQVQAKFDKRDFIKGIGKNARKVVFGVKASVPPGPPGGWYKIMEFTMEELEKRFYLGTENSIRFRVNVDFMKEGFVAQVTFKNQANVEKLRTKLDTLNDKLEFVGLRVLFNDEIYWNNEGNRLIVEGKPENALHCFDRAIEMNPSFELPWLNKASIALSKMEFEKVVELSTKASELHPGWGKAWETRAMGLINQGKNEEALKYLERASELEPEEWTLWDNRGRALMNLGRLEDAVETYQKSLRINPDNAEVLWLLGATLHRVGETSEALAWVEKAVAKAPKDVRFLREKGALLIALNRNEDAIVVFDEILDLEPKLIEIETGKSLAYYNLGKYDPAISCCDRQLNSNASYAIAWYNKACYQSKKGLFDDSITCLKRAIELEPKFAESAKEEADFEPLRADQRFMALTGLKSEVKAIAQ